jgi:hypothetical protein
MPPNSKKKKVGSLYVYRTRVSCVHTKSKDHKHVFELKHCYMIMEVCQRRTQLKVAKVQ